MSRFLHRLSLDISGLAAVEFALSAPFVLAMFLSGAELTNYAIAKLRVSQIALHVADNGSRIGTDQLLSAKQISETQINDLLIGANLQAGTLNLSSRGRVILSSLEQDPSHSGKMYVHWQRCYGGKSYTSAYGVQGTNNLSGFGPTGKQITSIASGTSVMYVEVAYDYKPLISARLVPTTVLTDVGAMVVRDDRDLTGGVGGSGVYNNEGATASTC